MATQNLAWVRVPVTWVIVPGWIDTTWSIEVMDPGLLSEEFLIDPLESLPLVLYGLLWDFPNIQATQGRSFMILMSFLDIIPLSYSLMRDLKEQWFSLWCQSRISLSSRPRRSSVDHSLSMSPLVISAHILYFPLPPGWWVFEIVSWLELGGLLLPPGSCLGPRYRFSRCHPRELPWCAPLEWRIWVDMTLSGISICLLGKGNTCNPLSWARKVLIGYHNRVPRSFFGSFFAWRFGIRGGLCGRRIFQGLLIVGFLWIN